MPSPSPPDASLAYDAVVLSGGTARRLGGVDKAMLDVAGISLLGRALTICSGAHRRVVVGPHVDLPSGVEQTREEPPGGGPVAALAAGLGRCHSDVVVVLACDMPFVGRRLLETLVTRVGTGVDAAMPVDDEGRRQPLAAAYDHTALRTALACLGRVDDASVRRLISGLTVDEVPVDAGTTTDCDTWPHIHEARRRLEHP